MELRTLDDLEVAGKRVLLRSDLNVPLDGERITDDFRIRASIPTITELLERGAVRVVIASHLGRPKGEPDARYSLAPVAARLGELLGRGVPLASGPAGPVEEDAGEVVLLENVRFHPGETKNDIELARALSLLADVYVDDAFGAVHRAHASVAAVAEMLPSAAGRLLEREVFTLTKLMRDPERPFVAVVGGAKVSDKLLVLDSLLSVVDRLLIGGAMCFTFFLAKGMSVGASLVEPDRVEDVRALMERAGERLLLPEDLVAAERMAEDADVRIVDATAISEGFAGYDIGPRTREAYVDVVASARTVLWNGPMGVFEMKPFASGTEALARGVAESDAYSVVGGGDSVAAIEQMGFADRIGHVSSGGGAMLEMIEGKELPGLVPLLRG